MRLSTVLMGSDMGRYEAALRAHLFVLRAEMKAMEFLDHSDTTIRNIWNVKSETADAIEVEIKRVEVD